MCHSNTAYFFMKATTMIALTTCYADEQHFNMNARKVRLLAEEEAVQPYNEILNKGQLAGDQVEKGLQDAPESKHNFT